MIVCITSTLVDFVLTGIVFDWSNAKNGRLLATIGIISALLQGGYTRTASRKIGEGVMARRGVISCAVSFLLFSTLPQLRAEMAPPMIFVAAVFLAFTSATVVSSLTALASLQCDDEVSAEKDSPLTKGKALGQFRSAGQLGRAIGPLLGTFIFLYEFFLLTCNASMRVVLDFWPNLDVFYGCSINDRSYIHDASDSKKVLNIRFNVLVISGGNL